MLVSDTANGNLIIVKIPSVQRKLKQMALTVIDWPEQVRDLVDIEVTAKAECNGLPCLQGETVAISALKLVKQANELSREEMSRAHGHAAHLNRAVWPKLMHAKIKVGELHMFANDDLTEREAFCEVSTSLR